MTFASPARAGFFFSPETGITAAEYNHDGFCYLITILLFDC